YVEIVKRRAYNNDANTKFTEMERNAAVKTLRDSLKTLLELLAPVNAAMNYHIYKEMFGANVHAQKWPTKRNASTTIVTKELIDFNSAIWKAKKDATLSLKDPIKKGVAPESLSTCEKEIKATHNIIDLTFGKEIIVEAK
ncbi:MAG TPA: class I tRNA ligase family protein, partial [archaeon]|nr:class I tRNA ligase family protein [archaeon]